MLLWHVFVAFMLISRLASVTRATSTPFDKLICKSSRRSVLATIASAMSYTAFRDVLGTSKVLGTVDMIIKYGSHKIEDGARVTKAQAAHAPDVEYNAAPGKHYSLLMVDPDAPSPDNPTNKEWLHWIVVNIPGSDVKSGHTVTAYNGPTPPRGTHRYIFLLYEQPEGVVLQPQAPAQRGKFHAAKWAAEQQLGDPVAALHFTTAAGE